MDNKQEQQYIDLLNKVLDEGCKKQLKYGDKVLDEYCLSLFGESLKFDCRDWTLPLYTHRKINWKNGLREMLWFIEGSGDVVKLHKSGVKFWDEWGLKFLKDSISPFNYKNLSKNVKAVGYELHKHTPKGNHIVNIPTTLEDYRVLLDNDYLEKLTVPLHYTNGTNLKIRTSKTVKNNTLNQTKWVIDTLRKNPDARHCKVEYWRPEDTYEMAKELGRESVILPACHTGYTVNINHDLVCLHITFRSQDEILGNPTNVSQYAFLMFMYAKCLGREPGWLKMDITDAHIYSNQIPILEKVDWYNLHPFPKVEIQDRDYKYLEDFTFEDFNVVGYKSNKGVNFPITVVGGF
jgi:thymidylate synthase